MNLRHLALAGAIAAAAIAPLAASAETPDAYGGYGRHGNGPWNGNARYANGNRLAGEVAAVDGGSLKLRSGRTVFLKDGTVINPRGQSLQPGQRITAFGSSAGDGNLNAQTISIDGNAGYGNGGKYRYDNDGNYGGDDARHRHGRHRNDRDDRDDRDDRNH